MPKSRRFVIGDIHGAHKALIQCFNRAGFRPESDLLISLGDICDRWPEVDKVFNVLLGIKKLVLILGNHDAWALEWFLHNRAPDVWIKQGGSATIQSYKSGIPEKHIQLLSQAVLFYILENRLFVHGGFKPDMDPGIQGKDILLWDRSLIRTAMIQEARGGKKRITRFEEVYVGHTPTLNFGTNQPINACEVYLMDTGAGWSGGVLTLMDIDSRKIYQSDPVDILYPA